MRSLPGVQSVEGLRLRIPMRYDPNRPQRRFHRASGRSFGRARFVCAVAGRRGGKTQAGASEMAQRVVDDLIAKLRRLGPWKPTKGSNPEPFLRYGVVAPTYALLNEPKVALQRYLGHQRDGGLIVHQDAHTWWLKGGVRLDMMSGDRPDRLVGMPFDGLWNEEAARTKAAVWTDNLRPTLSDRNGWALFTSTPVGRNWLWEEVWARCNAAAAAELSAQAGSPRAVDPQYAGVHWTTAENDAIPGLVAEMALAEAQMPRAMFLRNYFASFDAFAGQLFGLDAARHQRANAPAPHAARRVFAGGDLGLEHPAAFVLAAEDSARNWHEVGTLTAPDTLYDLERDWLARDRLFGPALTRACWTVQVYRMFRDYAGDGWSRIKLFLPTDGGYVKRQFRARGFTVADAFQDHEPAVSFFQGLIHTDRFLFRAGSPLFRCCQNLRVPEAGQRSSKLWLDEMDDPWDALRYALSTVIKGGESPLRASFSAMNWMA